MIHIENSKKANQLYKIIFIFSSFQVTSMEISMVRMNFGFSKTNTNNSVNSLLNVFPVFRGNFTLISNNFFSQNVEKLDYKKKIIVRFQGYNGTFNELFEVHLEK